MPNIKTDVLVVGAGPAGTTAARFAALNGAEVTIIDRKSEIGAPVRCGELMTSNEEVSNMFPKAGNLEELFDVIPDNLRLRDIEGIRLVNPKGKETEFPFTGYTTDRDRFDQHLAKLAVEEGAELISSCQFSDIEDGRAVTSLGEIEYKVIIGADGPGSRVSRALGLPRPKNPYPAVTAQADGDFDPYIVMFFGGIAPGAYSWIIPKDGRANVGVGFSPKFSDGTLSEYFNKFVLKHDLNITTKLAGKHVPSEGPVSNTVAGNGMTVGDAAGHVISVNGGGVPLALMAGRICGKVAADNISDGRPLEDYQTEWRRVMLPQLRTAARDKKLADIFAFGSDFRTGLCMSLLGKRRMANLIRCKGIFP
ncbi:MAG: NAD(P)/FAD-dependent oxidoreductase [Thermoplasmatales archaeon]|nr:NAD(P)/FAD-dependent oxidoreductase [Thermoplasmatales archaeon]